MTERPNIRRMQMPENLSQGEPFDYRKDISPLVWDKLLLDMKEAWAASQRKGARPFDGSRAAHIKLLDSGKLVPLTEENWARVEETYQNNRTRSTLVSGHSLLNEAATMAILDPERKPTLTAEEVGVVTRKALELETSKELSVVDYEYFKNLIIFDKKLLPAKPLAEIFARDFEAKLDSCRSDNDYRKFARVAAAMRFIAPQHELKITHEDWANLTREWKKWTAPEEVKRYQPWATQELTEFAADLKMLAAESIEITEIGIFISPPKRTGESHASPSQPESLSI